MLKESPGHVRLSLAAAMTLRLASGRFYRKARLYCINLLLTYADGCVGRCSYCGLSKEREGEYEEKSFIRVAWPIYKLSTVRERLNKYAGWVERICISMITNRRAVEDTIAITSHLREEIDLPISLLISPTLVADSTLRRFKDAGAEMVGIAIDAATEELFVNHRGNGVKDPHKWAKYWQVLEEAVGVFGKDKTGCHLIVGLGETEQEMVETIQRVRDLGARTHLFSFHPEVGSLLEDSPSCDVGQYRRVQLSRYLIDHGLSSKYQMSFDDQGRIINFGLNGRQLEQIIESGKPFQTSGCPGKTMEGACNRPFGDGPPSDIRSFPFELNQSDLKKVRKQMTG
ncbi:MAG: radical SAM protein [bacterium]